MLETTILVFTILIFPIFLNIKIVANYTNKKMYFLLEIFGFIKIISGYMQLRKNVIIIHLSDNKAILFEIIDLDGIKKKFKPIMDYHFISLETLTELGNEKNLINPLCIAFITNYFLSFIRWGLLNKKPYLKFNNNFNVYENENKLNFYGKTLITLNLLMVLLSVIKIILEKIIYGYRKNAREN